MIIFTILNTFDGPAERAHASKPRINLGRITGLNLKANSLQPQKHTGALEGWRQPSAPLQMSGEKATCVCTVARNRAVTKEELLPFPTARMGLESPTLSGRASQRKTNTIWCHLRVQPHEQNKLTKQKRRRGPRETTDSCQSGGGMGDRMKEGEGVSTTPIS